MSPTRKKKSTTQGASRKATASKGPRKSPAQKKSAMKSPERKKLASKKKTTASRPASTATTKKKANVKTKAAASAAAKKQAPSSTAVKKKANAGAAVKAKSKTAPMQTTPEPRAKMVSKKSPPKVSRRKSTARSKSSDPGATGVSSPISSEPHSRLGHKYICFECDAKFYDLNRPEPICPKCGADQRKRPKRDTKTRVAAPGGRRARGRSMAPLLDDEDEDRVVVPDRDLEVGLDPVDADAGFVGEEEEEAEDPDES